MNPPKIWQFVQDETGSTHTWTWRRVHADGTIDAVSESHPDFGQVVMDALAHGFQPKRQAWMTKAGERITHFAPGDEALTRLTYSPGARLPPWRRATDAWTAQRARPGDESGEDSHPRPQQAQPKTSA